MKIPFDLRIDPAAVRDVVRAATSRLGALRPAAPSVVTGITEISAFGDNPGKLRMDVYAPPRAPRPGGPLVVVLHGCSQDAALFAADTGWVAAADRLGFPLVLPGQLRSNNQGGCFNWFQPSDVARGQGEAASIRAMVAEAARRFSSDSRRIFVVGLSAGGAMAANLLAAYPDAFAAGAVVAGLPVGAASNVQQALSAMANPGPVMPAAILAQRARAHGPIEYNGQWPRLSVWTGGADHTVAPGNARALARQWAGLYALDADAPATDTPAPGVRRDRWGAGYVELWQIDGMAHGYPVTHRDGDQDRHKRFVLDAPVSATDELLRFWKVDQT